MAGGRSTFELGWKWSTRVKPIAKTELCEAPHFACRISGALAVRMEDGPVVTIEFQGPADYAKMNNK